MDFDKISSIIMILLNAALIVNSVSGIMYCNKRIKEAKKHLKDGD